MTWSAKLFFFLFITYIVYIYVSGDTSLWKQIFTNKIAAPANTNTQAQTPAQVGTQLQGISQFGGFNSN